MRAWPTTPSPGLTELDEEDLRWADDEAHEDERDLDDRWATGRFKAFLDQPAYQPGPSGAAIDEALAWARERARKVRVRVDRHGDTDFSAGPVAIRGLPSWPPNGFVATRRRAAGYEFMDRAAADPPIAWDLARVTVHPEGSDLARWNRSLTG